MSLFSDCLHNGLTSPEMLYDCQVSGGQRDAGLQLPVQQLPGADGGAVVLEAAAAPPPTRRVGEQPRQPSRPPGGRTQRPQGRDRTMRNTYF
jgi:hypothetical protein